jgi:hypothetical protein
LSAQKGHGDRLRDCRISCGGRLKESPDFFFCCQQQCDLTLQVAVSAAFNIKESLAGFGVKPQSRMEEALYFPPTFLVHGQFLTVSQCYCIAGHVGWPSGDCVFFGCQKRRFCHT